MSEFDCFCKAFLALEKVLTEDELLIPQSAEVLAEAEDLKVKMQDVMDNMATVSETKFTVDVGVAVKEEDRPRLLVMAGSGSGLMQVCLFV